jgi:hypothetical protein
MKISTHTAGSLTSERTPIPSADKSGQIVANAVSNLAEKVFNVAEDMQVKQQKLDTALATSQYSVAMAEKEGALLSTPGLQSKDIQAKYDEASQQVRENILGGYDNGGTRQVIDAALQQTETQYKVRAVQQKFEFQKREELNKVFSTAEQQVRTAFSDSTLYASQVGQIKGLEQALVDRGYTAEAASKFVQNTLDNKAQYAIDDAIDNGQEETVYLAYNRGDFGSASMDKREQLGKQIAEALATKTQRAELKTQADALSSSIDLMGQYGALDMKSLTHRASSLEFELAEGTRAKTLSPSQINTLTKDLNFIETLRKSKLNMAYAQQRTDDPLRKQEIATKMAELVDKTGAESVLSPKEKMDALFTVRDELMKAFVEDRKISRRTFEEFSASIYGAYTKGFMEENFKGDWRWDWKRGGTPAGVENYFGSGDQKNVVELFKAVKKTKTGYDPKVMMHAFDEYLMDKRDNKMPITMTPEVAKQYVFRGWLSSNGYGTDFKAGDYLPTKFGALKILSIGDFGVPNYEVPQEMYDKIQQLKATNAGSQR